LLFHYIPGSERSHVSYLEAQRLGVYEPDPSAMLQIIREAVGLAHVSPRMALVRDGFKDRARELRRRSVERAMGLPKFLARVCDQPLSRQASPDSASATAG
jgi:hypothetical protein